MKTGPISGAIGMFLTGSLTDAICMGARIGVIASVAWFVFKAITGFGS